MHGTHHSNDGGLCMIAWRTDFSFGFPSVAPSFHSMSDDDDDSSSTAGDVGGKQAGDNSQIQVYGRVRPSGKNDKTVCLLADDSRSVEFKIPHDDSSGYINNKRESFDFKMNYIFPEKTTQEELFEGVGKKVVENVLQGFNSTIFAYGQTGSGKTFTITGGPDRYEDRGLIPRTLSMIFAEKENRSNEFLFSISLSYLEIYNDEGYDLLDAAHETKSLTELPKVAMFEDDGGNIHMKNIHLLPVASVDEALNLLFVGDTNRIICETPSNDASSRSHCIFTIYIESREVGGSRIRRSKLHLVDLAGSERVKKTGVGGKILTEALHINLALHYLEQVIVALHKRSRDKNVHIPYRNSMMTSVLRDSLGGNCLTVMIATLSAQRGHIDESISTCRFAARVAMVRNAAFVNEEIDPKLLIRRLKMQVRELKEELAAVQGKSIVEKTLDDDEKNRCREIVLSYLNADTPKIDAGLPNKYKVEACFNVFKEMILAAQANSEGGGGGGSGGGNNNNSNNNNQHSSSDDHINKSLLTTSSTIVSSMNNDEVKKLRLQLSSRDNEISILVNMLKQYIHSENDIEVLESIRHRTVEQTKKDYAAGGMTMNASQSAVSSTLQDSLLLSKSVQQLKQIHQPGSGALSPSSSAASSQSLIAEDSSLIQQRLSALNQFKQSYSKNSQHEAQKNELKSKIEQAQRYGENINKCREEINALKAKIEQRRMQQGVAQLNSGADASAPLPPDAEEESLKAAIEQSKLLYRTSFHNLKELKGGIEHLKAGIERSRRKLQQDFDSWWSTQSAVSGNAASSSMQKEEQLRAAARAGAAVQAASAAMGSNSFSPSPPTSNSARGAGGLIASSMASVNATSPSPPFLPALPPHPHRALSASSSTFTSSSSSSASSTPSSAHGSLSGRGSSGPLQPVPTRLLSTGNAAADADIQKFYEMRDSLIKQQQMKK